MKPYTSHNFFYVTITLFLFVTTSIVNAQFTPGEGGALPKFPTFEPQQGKISGLYIAVSQRNRGAFANTTRAELELNFPEPFNFKADSYTLQYSENGTTWDNYQPYGTDFISTYNNFSFYPEGNYHYRLKVNGGPKDGFTSNEVYAPLTSIDSFFSGWGLDEGWHITGIMIPDIGRGLEAYFNVISLEDNTPIVGHLSYQWYRVNPETFETTAIEGATQLKYVTVEADAGHHLLIRATGDENKVGGMRQVISLWKNQITNMAYADQANTQGFNLNLKKEAEDIDLVGLSLIDKEYNEVTITAVQKTPNKAIFHIAATLDEEKDPYQLRYDNKFWRIGSQLPFAPMIFDYIEVNLSNSGLNNPKYNVAFSVNGNILNFNADEIIQQISIYDITGRKILSTDNQNRSGSVSLPQIRGIFLVEYKINNERGMRKIFVD
ncbi:hypothetical protein MASR2M117_00820 [Paludibacter sp.]